MDMKKRAGKTKITSVSIPFDLLPLIEKHSISPTLALKKGIGIELYMRGVPQYQSITNEERHEYLSAMQKNQEFEEKINTLQNSIRKLLFDLEYVKKEFLIIKGGKKDEFGSIAK